MVVHALAAAWTTATICFTASDSDELLQKLPLFQNEVAHVRMAAKNKMFGHLTPFVWLRRLDTAHPYDGHTDKNPPILKICIR